MVCLSKPAAQMLLACIICVTGLLFLAALWFSSGPQQKLNPIISIVVWSPYFSGLENAASMTVATPRGSCVVSSNRSNADFADVVLFPYEPVDRFVMPTERRRNNALWVYLTREPPTKGRGFNMPQLDGLVNGLMTYTQTTTIKFPYGSYTWRSVRLDEIPSWITATRPKIAITVISNCKSAYRIDMLNRIFKSIHVDVAGLCGITRHILCDAHNVECFTELGKEYLFYLAIENSECADYVSEKVWRNAFSSGMVPIVYSSAKIKYSSILPPHSYFDLADYYTMDKANEALLQIAANPSLYAAYHQWRMEYEHVEYSNDDAAEILCEYALGRSHVLHQAINVTSARQC